VNPGIWNSTIIDLLIKPNTPRQLGPGVLALPISLLSLHAYTSFVDMQASAPLLGIVSICFFSINLFFHLSIFLSLCLRLIDYIFSGPI
ncbi:MAG: hypothetical protein AAGM21_16925, partial [Pseudomonadota bacterium]